MLRKKIDIHFYDSPPMPAKVDMGLCHNFILRLLAKYAKFSQRSQSSD